MLVPMFVFVSVLQRCLCVDFTYYVEEEKNPGTYISDLAADMHLMERVPLKARSQVLFELVETGTSGNLQWFRVGKKTGKLYTAQTLDAESLCQHNKECSRIIRVAVQQAKIFMKILKVKVILQDINDHRPEFPEQKVEIQFEEDDRKGVRKSIPNAIDRDVGIINSQILYELKKNMDDPFTLSVSKTVDGTSDLIITLEDMLDREVKDSYVIQVIAKDGGSPPKQSILDVHISITDVNDNTPVFSQNVYNVSIKYEYNEAIPIAILSARDSDSGQNGQILYHFSSRTSELAKTHFKIDEETGEIFVQKAFTPGQNQAFELFVKATDGGNPPLSSIAMILINMVNQQNHAPSIAVNFFSASTENTAAISEDVEVGSFIAYIIITDPDFGQNGEVTCDLHHNKFQLQSLGTKEYKITVKSPVDRETLDHHEITISCQDKGSPPLQSERKFSIQILDVNDVRPQFSKGIFKLSINENEKANFPVGAINASDPDLGAGGKLTYTLLTSSKQFLPFQITDEGLISTVMSLDHEFQDIYDFKVFVKDNGSPPLNNTVNVIIEVKDENDNAPYFTFPSINPFTLDFVYYPRHTNNITVLKASDIDSRENAFLKYEIIRGNDNQLFTINHYTGLLSFSRVVTQQDAGSYNLAFVVKDSGTPVLSAKLDMILKLTVSNKTSEMLNSEQMNSDDSVHLFLMIVVLVVAVSVSVSITAGLSICIVRCKDRRNSAHRERVNPPCKCTMEHGNYMCPSQQSAYWPDDPIALTADHESTRTLSRGSARGHYPTEELNKGPKTADGVYQVSTTCSVYYLLVFFFILCDKKKMKISKFIIYF